MNAARAVIYHMGAPVTPPAGTWRRAHLRWEWARHFDGVPDGIAASLCAYLECAGGTRNRSTVSHMATRLAHFARTITRAFCADHDIAYHQASVYASYRQALRYLNTVAAA